MGTDCLGFSIFSDFEQRNISYLQCFSREGNESNSLRLFED